MVPARSGTTKERVYLTELAAFLGHSVVALRRFAKSNGLLKRVSIGACRSPLSYVTPYGAQRLIAYARAIQGDWHLKGRDFHGVHERDRVAHAKRLAERRLQATVLGKESG